MIKVIILKIDGKCFEKVPVQMRPKLIFDQRMEAALKCGWVSDKGIPDKNISRIEWHHLVEISTGNVMDLAVSFLKTMDAPKFGTRMKRIGRRNFNLN